jgi:transmembrane secretion effector
MQLTFIIGPTVGGFAIAWIGVANTYWFDVISYFIVIGSLLLMVVPRVPIEKRAQAGIGALVDGIKFLRAHPVILLFSRSTSSPRSLVHRERFCRSMPARLCISAHRDWAF